MAKGKHFSFGFLRGLRATHKMLSNNTITAKLVQGVRQFRKLKLKSRREKFLGRAPLADQRQRGFGPDQPRAEVHRERRRGRTPRPVQHAPQRPHELRIRDRVRRDALNVPDKFSCSTAATNICTKSAR